MYMRYMYSLKTPAMKMSKNSHVLEPDLRARYHHSARLRVSFKHRVCIDEDHGVLYYLSLLLGGIPGIEL